eukprot:CAMPEP_0170512044 /NCGR_PEP_ID=MMETSP0208-20121228/66635_1 /TAXON_ID=197538 /ORGANISM="Strombidium inclinatum, Strain S3" /LENGTH=126 /DNA_ID=CAMNT_0010795635 /DNA_START=164 /DNA_END=544 /DNA_ORIENTATION=+
MQMPLLLLRPDILRTNVDVDADYSCIFRLKTEAVYNISLAIAVHELRADKLLNLLDSCGTTKEEAVDFRLKGGSRPPSFDLNLMVTWVKREADEAVAFYAVAVPAVFGVDLEEEVGAIIFDSGLLH